MIAIVVLTHEIGAFTKFVQAGGFYLNDVRVTDRSQIITEKDVLFGSLLILRSGKKDYRVVELI